MMNLLSNSTILRQYFVVIIVNLSVVCVSISQVWTSPVLVKLKNATATVLPEPITEDQGSWIVSVPFLSAAIATPLCCFLVDKVGRRNCMIIASVPRVLICLLFVLATQIHTLIIGRLVLGVLDSLSFAAVPIYTSEVASKECRGSLGSIIQIASSLGILLVFSVGPFVSYVTLNIIYASVSLAAAVPLLLLPESPYFLFSKGKEVESRQVLLYFRGSAELVEKDIEEYKANSSVKINGMELLNDKLFLKSLFLVLVMSAGFQLVGCAVMTFYLETIIKSTKTSVSNNLVSVIIGVIQIVSSIGTNLTIDRYNRKSIINVTLVGMAFGMIGLGTYYKIKESHDIAASSYINYLPLVSIAVVVYCFSAGLGSINWILSAELFEDKARGVGVLAATLNTSIFVFVLSKCFPSIIETIGSAATYWIFSVNCVLLCLFVAFFIPETKGKTYAEIQKSLGKKEQVKA